MWIQRKCILFEHLFNLSIFLTCIGVVTWQCMKCFNKFISKPKGTHVSIMNTASGILFPSISVCPNPIEGILKSEILNECGLSKEDYFFHAKWSNQSIEKCADPKTLYHDIIKKPKDIIQQFLVQFWDLSTLDVLPNDTLHFHYIDSKEKYIYSLEDTPPAFWGCYTFNPSLEIMKRGIFGINIKPSFWNYDLRVFVSNIGMLGIKKAEDNQFINTPKRHYNYTGCVICIRTMCIAYSTLESCPSNFGSFLKAF